MTILNSNSKKITTILSLVVLFLVGSEGICADSVTKLKVPEQYLVESSKCAVMRGATRYAEASLGALLEVTHHRGPWRYSSTVQGWVHVKNLVPLKDALTEFSSRIEKDPTPRAFHLRGIAYMANQQWGRAVNDLEEAYSLGDSSVTLHINLGTCFQQLKLYERAEEEFASVIESYPSELSAYQARGDLYMDTARIEPALKDFAKVIELDPKFAEAHNSMGVALRLLGKYSEAIQSYTNCLEADPKFMPAYVNRGYAYKSTGGYQLALQDYEKALKLVEGAPSAQNDLAWLLATCEDQSFRDGDRAVTLALSACRKVEYRNPEYVDTLAAAYAEIGNFEKAIETVQTAIELFGNNAMKAESEERLVLYRNNKAYTDHLEKEGESDDQKPSEEQADSASEKAGAEKK